MKARLVNAFALLVPQVAARWTVAMLLILGPSAARATADGFQPF